MTEFGTDKTFDRIMEYKMKSPSATSEEKGAEFIIKTDAIERSRNTTFSHWHNTPHLDRFTSWTVGTCWFAKGIHKGKRKACEGKALFNCKASDLFGTYIDVFWDFSPDRNCSYGCYYAP